MKVELRYAQESDIAPIVADARQADIEEMAALGTTVEQAMVTGLKLSDWAATGLIDDVPVCMFGVAPASILAGLGVPWLISTHMVERYEKTFLRRCRPGVDAMLRSYPRLSNVVMESNTAARRWLGWLGFEFNVDTVQINGVAFRQFRKGEFHV